MLRSIVSSIVLAGVVASAASAPMRARDEPDFVVDVVEEINCTPLDHAFGPLIINSQSGAPTTLAATGVPLTVINGTLQEDDGSSDQAIFSFLNCTSSFMDLSSDGVSVFYGHLELASDTTQCLISYPGQPSEQPILTDNCSPSDDSGQMLQFWKITLNADPTAAATIDFVGKSTRQTSDTSYYTTDFTGEEGSRAAEINRVALLNPATYYEISLVPTSN